MSDSTVARYFFRLRLRFFRAISPSKPNSARVRREVFTVLRVSLISFDCRMASMGMILDARRAGIQTEIKMVNAASTVCKL